MSGTDAVRHCGSCDSNVWNLSAMDDTAVEALLASGEQACIRFYARADGTLVKTNCSTGPRRAPSAVTAGLAMSLATTTAFLGIDAVTGAPEVATIDDQPVLVAMGGIRLKIRVPPPRAGFSHSRAHLALRESSSDASVQLGAAEATDPTPSTRTWRALAAGTVFALVGLFTLVARRKRDVGEPR